MQPDESTKLQAMAIQLICEKEQETMRLLDLALAQNQKLLVQLQQHQSLVGQQQQIIERLLAELCAFRSVQQPTFGLVHTN